MIAQGIASIAFLPDRVLAKIVEDPDTGCLLWTGATNQHGYPRVWNGVRLVPLARWVAIEVHGPPPTPKHQAGHLCHDHQLGACPVGMPDFCPHRLCGSPHHIAWQTASANILASPRTVASRNTAKTTCRLGHALLRVTVDAAGRHSRHCYECRTPAPWSVVSDEDREANLQYERELSASYAACL